LGIKKVRIDKINIENFKLFDNREFSFNSEFNLIVGVNGSGKTSLLRAIAVAAAGWAHAYIKDDNNRRPIADDEIREVQLDNRFDKTKWTWIEASGTATIVDQNGEKKPGHATWRRIRQEPHKQTSIEGSIFYDRYPRSYNLKFNQLGSDILNYIEKGNPFDLPLIAFYECDRIWRPMEELNIEASAVAKYSRFDPYKDCFHTGADHKAIGQWLIKHELASLQKQTDTPILESIKLAARIGLEGCVDFRFDVEASRVLVEFEDGKSVPFEHLSDGQRIMLGLFVDIARRVAVLNPHRGGEAAANTSGIVLIDELDLHLHPRWQRKIISDLRRAFPKIQFICTTHSPQLIGQVKSEEIILLGEQTLSDNPAQSFGMDSNWVLRNVMDSDDRDPTISNKLDKIFELIDNESYDDANTEITLLRTEIGEHPDLVEANALISRFTKLNDAVQD